MRTALIQGRGCRQSRELLRLTALHPAAALRPRRPISGKWDSIFGYGESAADGDEGEEMAKACWLLRRSDRKHCPSRDSSVVVMEPREELSYFCAASCRDQASRLRAQDLTAGPALFGRERLTLQCQCGAAARRSNRSGSCRSPP